LSDKVGKVYLVGAGPGDPELVTLKATRLLREADVVLFDRLLSPDILRHAEKALPIDVGKSAGRHKLSQEEINQLLVEKAKEGKTVVRLKGGDPYVFGRGGEEALELKRHGIPFEVVPGVTSAIAVPELAGIPVTHRGVSTSLTIVTGHEEPGKDDPLDWTALAGLGGTLVVLMGVSRLDENTKALMAGGRSPHVPAAVIEKGGWPEQRLVAGTLGDIAIKAKEAYVQPPAILVVGEVVSLARHLAPLRIALFRPDNQQSETSRMAESFGFRPIFAPSIALKELSLPEDLEARLQGADYIVFTSSNGVEIALRNPKIASEVGSTKVAAIGPKTALALRERGVAESSIPDEYSSAGLTKLLRSCKKVVLLRSKLGSPKLREELLGSGVEVEDIPLYEIVGSRDPRLDDLIRRPESVDIFAFTSASTARHLLKRAGELEALDALRRALVRSVVAAIGPPTTKELKSLGIRVDVMPERFTFPDMLAAIKDRLQRGEE
jgi:uroporphyrinogen III methyltransferase/synthase